MSFPAAYRGDVGEAAALKALPGWRVLDCLTDQIANGGDSLAASPMREQDAVPLLAFVERHKLFARGIFHLEQPFGPRKRATHGVAARSSAF